MYTLWVLQSINQSIGYLHSVVNINWTTEHCYYQNQALLYVFIVNENETEGKRILDEKWDFYPTFNSTTNVGGPVDHDEWASCFVGNDIFISQDTPWCNECVGVMQFLLMATSRADVSGGSEQTTLTHRGLAADPMNRSRIFLVPVAFIVTRQTLEVCPSSFQQCALLINHEFGLFSRRMLSHCSWRWIWDPSPPEVLGCVAVPLGHFLGMLNQLLHAFNGLKACAAPWMRQASQGWMTCSLCWFPSA